MEKYISKIEKEFDEFYRKPIMTGGFQYPQGRDKVALKSFLKQSFIKYLKAECERLSWKKNELIDNYGCTGLQDENWCCKKHRFACEAIDDIITYYQAQIKELEV